MFCSSYSVLHAWFTINEGSFQFQGCLLIMGFKISLDALITVSSMQVIPFLGSSVVQRICLIFTCLTPLILLAYVKLFEFIEFTPMVVRS